MIFDLLIFPSEGLRARLGHLALHRNERVRDHRLEGILWIRFGNSLCIAEYRYRYFNCVAFLVQL